MKFKRPKIPIPSLTFPRLSITSGLVILCLTLFFVGIFFLLSPTPTEQFEVPLELPLAPKPPEQARSSATPPQEQQSPLSALKENALLKAEILKPAEAHTDTTLSAELPLETSADSSLAPSKTQLEGQENTAAGPPENQTPAKGAPEKQLAKNHLTEPEQLPAPLLPAPQPDAPHFYNACLESYQSTGWLPKISLTGVRPFDIYQNNQSIDIVKTPLSIIIRELGQSEEIFQYLQTNLPPQISYAFFPRGQFSQQQNSIARARGIETWLHIPLEPLLYPDHDPGFETLLTGLERVENLQRLHNHLSQITGYIGVMPYMGSRFGRVQKDFKPFLQEIAARGLAYIEAKEMRSKAYEWYPQLNWLNARATVDIPRGLSESQLRDVFAHVAAQLEKGKPIILSIEPDLFALQQLQAWLQQLDPEKIALVALSNQIQGR